MSVLIQYLVKLSISLSIVWLFYQFVLRRLTFYNSNRWYLLGYSLLSFLIPFIDISPVLEKSKVADNDIVQFIPVIQQYTTALEDASHCPVPVWSTNYDKWDWIAFAIMTGAAILLLRFIIRFVSFLRIQRNAELIYNARVKLYQVNENIIPFSFGNAVFINSRLHSEAELQEIIRHEFVHVKQQHTVDIIWGEILCILNWYNPFAWLLKNSIRQNLEFVADNKALENGIDRKQYQYLLLKVIGNNHFSIAQKFNFSSLKKRIAMMNRLKTARIHLLRFLFVLPLLAVILISFRQEKQDSTQPPEKNNKSFFLSNDTIPGELNEKGYIIDVIGRNSSAIIVVKDKSGKTVERIAYAKWKGNEKYYEEKYGELPPPPLPPLPPDPPTPPQPMELPDNVKKIEVNNKKVTVTLKNGAVEKYDLHKPDEKAAFEKKYGEIIPPPPPTPPARVTHEMSATQEINRTNISDDF
jgi:beta-lactamase regulating signal transducer with metallopeptidase domain